MRLLNTTTYELSEFIGDVNLAYAILSHTWGSGEVLYQHITSGTKDWYQLEGAVKVLKSCEVALSKGYDWIWIDTCCIDKSSSAELSESINSMFRWYEKSGICIAYLVDVSKRSFLGDDKISRWFYRGWTLQELIAPPTVEFWDSDWVYIDTKASLSKKLADITKIDILVLRHTASERSRGRSWIRPVLNSIPVANIMSWASRRQTSRPEDMAYCLLGLFDINMPLLYGEG